MLVSECGRELHACICFAAGEHFLYLSTGSWLSFDLVREHRACPVSIPCMPLLWWQLYFTLRNVFIMRHVLLMELAIRPLVTLADALLMV